MLSHLGANPVNLPGHPVLSYSSTPKHAQKLEHARDSLRLKKKRSNVLMRQVPGENPEGDGGGYVTSVEQLPWQYNHEIGIGPNVNDNPIPNFYVTENNLNAM